MALSDILLTAYVRQKQLKPGLRKGQFMQELFDDKYKNEASARRGFNKVTQRETTGVRLEREVEQRNRLVGPTGMQRKRRGLGELGLWKINVTFHYIDNEGNDTTQQKSFVADSGEYTSVLDMPYVKAILEETSEEKISEWLEQYPAIGNWTSYEIEVFAIDRSDLPTERIIHLDDLEIEDGEYYE